MSIIKTKANNGFSNKQTNEFQIFIFSFSFDSIYDNSRTFIIIMLRIQNFGFTTVLIVLLIGVSVEAENAIVDPPYTENVQ